MDGFKRRTSRPVPAPTAKPPERPGLPPATAVIPQAPATPALEQDELPPITEPEPAKPAVRRSRRRLAVIVGLVTLVGLVVAAGAAYLWYHQALTPVDDGVTPQKIVITKDSSFGYVVQKLKERGVIKSELAAKIYGYTSGKKDQMKEGTCIITGTSSTPEIIDKLAAGCHDFIPITFYPGATIEKPLYKPVHAQLSQDLYVKKMLANAGFTDARIQSALTKHYTGPLFAGKPEGSSLEGYVYGETYYIDKGATADEVLQTTFDQMYQSLSEKDLVKKFQAQNLNLFQAITLASIVQRELNCEGKPTQERIDRCYGYQRTIAQIFLKRLHMGMTLGSDVTFIYAADQMGVVPSPTLDSPYNTRIHPGLPPGPIASPGIHALMAVGNPSDTDYLFFIAGDDGLIYFAKDLAGHEANIKAHCQQLCNEL